MATSYCSTRRQQSLASLVNSWLNEWTTPSSLQFQLLFTPLLVCPSIGWQSGRQLGCPCLSILLNAHKPLILSIRISVVRVGESVSIIWFWIVCKWSFFFFFLGVRLTICRPWMLSFKSSRYKLGSLKHHSYFCCIIFNLNKSYSHLILKSSPVV